MEQPDLGPRRKILVIGGTLFIGRNLVSRLVKEGHDVTILHRKPGHELGAKVRELVADRNDGAGLAKAIEEAIINAMVGAETMSGARGSRVTALPRDQLVDVLKRHNRLTR